ncbi:translocation/assembly module TamB domain-containing protein [candidate division KSB1 bacterium]|nr:translocation/assembly module TamB domain-containing protein [candidate division KSB1 bacterium]
MKRALRIGLLWLPLTLLTVVVGLAAAALTRAVQTYAAHRALDIVNRRIHGQLLFTSVHARWNGELELAGVRLLDERGGFIAGFDTLRAQVALAELPDHVAHIRLLTVSGFRADIAFDSSRAANIAAALAPRVPQTVPAAATSDWKVVIDEFAVRADCTAIAFDTLFSYRSERWLLSGSLRYETAALDYSITFDDPAQLSIDAGGKIGLLDSLPSCSGTVGFLLDSAFAASLATPLIPVGLLNGHLQYATADDSLRTRFEIASPHVGRLHGAVELPFPPRGVALAGEISFDPLLPSSLWSDTTELAVRGTVALHNAGTADALNGWTVSANLDSITYGRYDLTALKLRATTADSMLRAEIHGGAARGTFAAEITVFGFDPRTSDLEFRATVEQLLLHHLLPDIPDSLSPMSGKLMCTMQNFGSDRRTLAVSAQLGVLQFGTYRIDSLSAVAHMSDAVSFSLDTARVWAYGFPVVMSAYGALSDSATWKLDIPGARISGLRPLATAFPILDSLTGTLEAHLHGVVSLRPQDSSAVWLAGDLRASELSLGADSVREIAIRLQDFNLSERSLRAVARARRIEARGQRIDSLSVLADGTLEDLGVTLRVWARADSIELTSDLRVQTEPGEFRLILTHAAALAFGAIWKTEGTTIVTFRGATVELDALRVQSPFGSLLAAGTLARPGEQDFAVELSAIRLSRIAEITKRKLPDAVLNIRAQFSGPDSNLAGDFSLTLDTVVVRGTPVLDRVIVNASTSSTATDLELLMIREADSLAFGHATLPAFLTFDGGFQLLDSLPMFGTVTLTRQTLAALDPILPYGTTVTGELSGDFLILGSPAIPSWSGQLRLQNGGYRDQRYGLNYENANVTLDVDRDTLRVSRLDVEADGHVRGDGSAVMAFPAPESLALNLNFDNFQAVNSRQIQARLDGNVILHGPLDSLTATGDLRFREALYRITQATTKQIEAIDVASEVARLRGDTTAQANSLADRIYRPMSHAIHIDIPGNMWLRGGGVNVELAGELWLYKNAWEEPYINGDILVRKGTVEVLGKEFRVPEDSGRVSFKGDITNPELAIRAFYTSIHDEQLSVSLSGTLLETRSELSGTTADGDSMTAAEVIYALIQAFVPSTDGDGGGLQEQIAAAGLSQLSSVVGKMAGLDLLQYRASDQGNLTQGSLEVGSYVTDRLFVRVLQPVESIQSGQEVTVEYRLLDWLKLSALQYGKDASEIKAVFQVEWR